MRKRIAALLCVLLLLSGCSGGAEPSDGYVLYFQERDLRSAAGEGALRTESVQLEPTEAPARALLEALLAGPDVYKRQILLVPEFHQVSG